MAKKKSSFHMGDEFNGSGKKTYLRAIQHNTYAPLPQHNVRLTPNFSRFVPVVIGGIPISTEEVTTQEDGVGEAMGSVPNVSEVEVRKKKNGKGYKAKFEVRKIQLTDGSYLHPKTTPEPKTEKDILEDILPNEESVSKLTPEQREQYKIYVSSILGAMNNVIVADADEVVNILEKFDILDPNSIMCFLIICAGESGGSVTETYKEGSDYRFEERGVGYIQVTYKDTQKKCLKDLKDMGLIKKK